MTNSWHVLIALIDLWMLSESSPKRSSAGPLLLPHQTAPFTSQATQTFQCRSGSFKVLIWLSKFRGAVLSRHRTAHFTHLCNGGNSRLKLLRAHGKQQERRSHTQVCTILYVSIIVGDTAPGSVQHQGFPRFGPELGCNTLSAGHDRYSEGFQMTHEYPVVLQTSCMI